jgi:hypothetical protein
LKATQAFGESSSGFGVDGFAFGKAAEIASGRDSTT